MAEDKSSFVGYVDWGHTFLSLENDEAGRLIKHFFLYVMDKNPEVPDRITQIAFEPIKQTLKRDLKKWERTKVKLSENGKKGGVKSGESRRKKQTKQTEASASNLKPSKQNEANEAVSDSVSVNVSDSVNENDIYLNIEVFQNFRNSEFVELGEIYKEKLLQYGVTGPLIRNTNRMPRQYIDVVEVLLDVLFDKPWQNSIITNYRITAEKFKGFMMDFVRDYVSKPALVYDESGFKTHFVNKKLSGIK